MSYISFGQWLNPSSTGILNACNNGCYCAMQELNKQYWIFHKTAYIQIHTYHTKPSVHVSGLVQDCSIFSILALHSSDTWSAQNIKMIGALKKKVISKQVFMRFEFKKSLVKCHCWSGLIKKYYHAQHKPKIIISPPVNVFAVYSKMYLS